MENGHGLPCAYCHRTMVAAPSRSSCMATRDHIVPQSQGGHRTVWACWTCNTLKGEMMPGEWRKFRDANPEWWKSGPQPFGKRRIGAARAVSAVVLVARTAEEIRALAKQIVEDEVWSSDDAP